MNKNDRSSLLEGKVILVSGASGGIGRGVCEAAAYHGAKVAFLWKSNREGAAQTQEMLEEIGAEYLSLCVDLARPEAAAETVLQVEQKWGSLDGLVNNAAVSESIPFVLIEDEDFAKLMEVNLFSSFRLCREAVRLMVRQKYGRIVNISSIAGSHTIPGPVHYAASKGGLDGLTRSLAHEVGPYGILVNAVSAGIFEGGLKSTIPANHLKRYQEASSLSRFGEPRECGEFVSWLLSEKNTYINGAILSQDGGTLG